MKFKQKSFQIVLVIAVMLSMMGVMTGCSDEDNPFFVEKTGGTDSSKETTKESTTEELSIPKETEKPTESTTETPTTAVETSEVAEPEGANDGDNFDINMDTSQLSNETIAWSFQRNTDHSPTVGYSKGIDLDKYGAHYIVDTTEKVIYLTFDEGYENGLTEQLLDTLAVYDVKAAFFVTEPYIIQNPDLCNRMVEEGHVIGNHSKTHPSMPDKTNEEIAYELSATNQAFLEATGQSLDPFFRPPMGNFSERVLAEVRKNGYQTIFWSLAYGDWDANNQPGVEVGYNHMMDNYHPGAIFLLHAVSSSSVGAIGDVIHDLQGEGYRFGSLYELE